MRVVRPNMADTRWILCILLTVASMINFTSAQDTTAGYGERCSEDHLAENRSICNRDEYLTCTGKECACASGMSTDVKTNKCYFLVGHGEECTVHCTEKECGTTSNPLKKCDETKNLTCKGGSCSCGESFYFSKGTCRPWSDVAEAIVVHSGVRALLVRIGNFYKFPSVSLNVTKVFPEESHSVDDCNKPCERSTVKNLQPAKKYNLTVVLRNGQYGEEHTTEMTGRTLSEVVNITQDFNETTRAIRIKWNLEGPSDGQTFKCELCPLERISSTSCQTSKTSATYYDFSGLEYLTKYDVTVTTSSRDFKCDPKLLCFSKTFNISYIRKPETTSEDTPTLNPKATPTMTPRRTPPAGVSPVVTAVPAVTTGKTPTAPEPMKIRAHVLNKTTGHIRISWNINSSADRDEFGCEFCSPSPEVKMPCTPAEKVDRTFCEVHLHNPTQYNVTVTFGKCGNAACRKTFVIINGRVLPVTSKMPTKTIRKTTSAQASALTSRNPAQTSKLAQEYPTHTSPLAHVTPTRTSKSAQQSPTQMSSLTQDSPPLAEQEVSRSPARMATPATPTKVRQFMQSPAGTSEGTADGAHAVTPNRTPPEVTTSPTSTAPEPVVIREHVLNKAMGHIGISWTVTGPTDGHLFTCTFCNSWQGVEETCTRVEIDKTFCDFHLVYLTRYNVRLTSENCTSACIYILVQEIEISVPNESVAVFSAEVVAKGQSRFVGGPYIVNITYPEGKQECFEFRTDQQCQRIASVCPERNATVRTQNKDDSVEVPMVLEGDLRPSKQYTLSVTPYFCNITDVHGDTKTFNITTKNFTGSINDVIPDPSNLYTVNVSWTIAGGPIKVNVTYNVTVKDALSGLQDTGDCATREDVTSKLWCSVTRAGKGSFVCSVKVPYAFWEYEVIVNATYRGWNKILTYNFETKADLPGMARNLSREQRYCPKDKVCFTWRDPCPRNRKAFISKYQYILVRANDTAQGDWRDYHVTLAYGLNASSYRRKVDEEHRVTLDKYDIGLGQYNFQVRAVSREGNISVEIASTPVILTAPKLPSKEELDRLVPEDEVESGEDSLSITITNASFLASSQAGKVEARGMIVTPNVADDSSERNKTGLISAYNRVDSYKDFVANGGTHAEHAGYRVDFSAEETAEIKKGGRVQVQLGDGDPSCETGGTKYCDGPLTKNTPYTVDVFVCNAVHCTKVRVVKNKKTKGGEEKPFLTPELLAVLGVGVTAWVAIGFLAYFVCCRKRRSRRPISELDSGSGGIIMAMRPRNTKPMLLIDLENIIAKKQRDESLLLREEYEEVKRNDITYPNDASLLDINVPKNRFADIMAFDHTRVKLSMNEQGSDYINANFIPGYSGRENEYIATQGPLHSTMNDFWRMVWEQKVSIIVMLTQTMERGQVKCEQYWPAIGGDIRQYGDIVVTNISVSNLNDYNITVFTLRHLDDPQTELEVKHFHYLKWLDMTADVQLKSVLQFVAFVRELVRPDTGPIVVHCSAGVGRTGTFICIDYVMQFIRERPITDHLDVFSFILKIRKARCRMVQTESQYILIHQCARNLMASRRRREEERKAENGKKTPPLANGTSLIDTPPPNPKKRVKMAATNNPEVHAYREETDDSGDELTEDETVEMEPAQYDAVKANAGQQNEAAPDSPQEDGQWKEEKEDEPLNEAPNEDESPADVPLVSSREQLYNP